MQQPPDKTRQQLSEEAAALRRQHRSGKPVYPALRALTTEELLHPAVPCAYLDLATALESICTAAQEAVRRRPGWLYLSVPHAPAAIVLSRPSLLQAAVYSVLREALLAKGSAVLDFDTDGGGITLRLRSSVPLSESPSTAPELLFRLVAEGGGSACCTSKGSFCAVLRFPLCPGAAKPRTAGFPDVEALLADRYSPVYLYLTEFCVLPEAP